MPWSHRESLPTGSRTTGGSRSRAGLLAAVFAIGLTVAAGAGALLSTAGTQGWDGILNAFNLKGPANEPRQHDRTIAALERGLAALTAEFAEFNSQRQAAGADAAGRFAVLEQAIAALKNGAGKSAPGELQRLEADIAAIRGELAALRTASANAQPGVMPTTLAGIQGQLTAAAQDIAALRASADQRDAIRGAEITALSDRLDKIEDTLAATEVTGSIPQAAPEQKPVRRSALAGWKLHSVVNGVATIKGGGETYEALEGMIVPGLGRIDEIKPRGTGWAVVTSRGVLAIR